MISSDLTEKVQAVITSRPLTVVLDEEQVTVKFFDGANMMELPLNISREEIQQLWDDAFEMLIDQIISGKYV